MKHRLRDLWWVWFILAWLAAGAALHGAASAHAYPVDCYTQTTYNGSRTTCYYGYPDYVRLVTTCDGHGRCSTTVL